MSSGTQDLLKKRASVVAAMQALTDKANAEKRDFTTDEEREFDERETEAKHLTRMIDRLGTIAQYNVDSTRAISTSAASYEAADETQVVQAEQKRSEGNHWGSFGEFLKAVVDAGTPGKRFDARLRETRGTPSGASEQVSADGGFLVNKDFATDLITRVYNTGALASRVRRIPISSGSNGLKLNVLNETSRADGSRFGGVRAYWLAEADAYTASKPVFRQLDFNLQKLGAAMYLTDELAADTTALQNVFEDYFVKEMAFVIDDAIMNGDGSGKPTGIRAASGSGIISVAKETGQAAATIVKENVFKMHARFDGSLANAAWFINRDALSQLYGLTLGDNGIYFPNGQFSKAPYGELMGAPVIPVEQCSTLGTVGDIVLADLSNYIWVDKGGIAASNSVHVRFLYDEQVLKFTYRCDGKPLYATALTPKNGTATTSSYVQLATRA